MYRACGMCLLVGWIAVVASAQETPVEILRDPSSAT